MKVLDYILNRANVEEIKGIEMALDRRRSEQAGFDHHLIKPVDFALLRAIVDRTEPEAR